MSSPVERRLVAIMSADVAGYSKLISSDEVATVRTLTAYREEMAVLVGQHNGRIVDYPGDNVLMEFPSATDAVEAAVEMQRVIGVSRLTGDSSSAWGSIWARCSSRVIGSTNPKIRSAAAY